MQLQGSFDLGTVDTDVQDLLVRTMEPAVLSVWLRDHPDR